MRLKRRLVYCAASISVVAMTFNFANAQGLSKLDRQSAEQMLKTISGDVEKHYYDPKIHGVDWNAKVAEFKQRIDSANSMNAALTMVAAALDTLNDSHTFFLPPVRPYLHDYGWKIQMIGDRCYVTEVRPNSDAESKGVKPGDEVLTVNGFTPTVDDMWKMNYLFNVLRPQPGLNIVVQTPSGQQRSVAIMAKIRQFKRVLDVTGENDAADIWQLIRQEETADHLSRARWVEHGDVMILKFPEFSDWSNSEIWDMLKKARDHKALIIDLRGNSGGSVDTLEQVISHIFDHDVKVADRVERNSTKPEVVKTNHHDQIPSKLIVLVDRESASASEIFARLVQIEKRGIILGDHTAGAVMEAKDYSYSSGMDTVSYYGASITEADLVMSDGKSLEHVGVMPDEMILPTAADLASGRDPVLSRAVAIAGENLDPQAASKLFPYEWAPE